DGSQLTKITNSATAADPHGSPDGREIAYEGDNKIFIIDADGSHQELLFARKARGGPVPGRRAADSESRPGRPTAHECLLQHAPQSGRIPSRGVDDQHGRLREKEALSLRLLPLELGRPGGHPTE